MLELMMLRLVAPRAFLLVNALGSTFFLITLLAIACGMIDHGGRTETYHLEHGKETR